VTDWLFLCQVYTDIFKNKTKADDNFSRDI